MHMHIRNQLFNLVCSANLFTVISAPYKMCIMYLKRGYWPHSNVVMFSFTSFIGPMFMQFMLL